VSEIDYRVYGPDANQPEPFKYIDNVLEVSEVGDAAVYLLNPQIVTPEGEWEAWFFASWSPPVSRYPSFWEMMQAEYQKFRKLNTLDAKRFRVKGDPQLIFTKLPGLVQEILESAQFYRKYLPMRSGLIELYDTGTIEALESIAERVRTLGAQHTDPASLVTALRQLAHEAEAEQIDLQPKPRDGFTRFNYLEMDFEKAASAATEFGRAEGLRQAAGQIQWFFNES
jgi:hypothetical protein